jgi:hypothetical protein
MSYREESLLNKPRQRVTAGKQALVVRPTDQDAQLELLDKLAQLESSLASVKNDITAVKSRGESQRFDVRTIVALGAVALSLAGYVVQDARNTSRQDAEIEMTKARVSNLEARIRTEVELKGLREGQEEIKQLLERHDNRSRGGAQRAQ